MKQQEEITIQSLANNEDVQIGYSDNEIVVVDSIQQFTQISSAHVAMNAIVICTSGKAQAQMNGIQMELHRNQIAIIPQNVTVTDVMVSPDFDVKGMFLTNRILRSFLNEKISVWNDMMYIHRQHIVTMDEDEILFYTHFYDMLTLAIEKGKENPFHTEIIQSLLRSAILGLCGEMKWMLAQTDSKLSTLNDKQSTTQSHFQRFLDLLHTTDVKHRTVEAYANDLYISPKYLTTICKKNSGKTANEWITEQVLEDIRYCLKQTDMSIKQICDRLGFPNPSFFGKYVKDHFGMTPIQLREKT
jgi:AraC-like DNA-binding protein